MTHAAYRAWCESLYGNKCWIPSLDQTARWRAHLAVWDVMPLRKMQNHDPGDEDVRR